MRSRVGWAVVLFLTVPRCAHQELTLEPGNVPLELYQDNQLGPEYTVVRVDYSLEGEQLEGWTHWSDKGTGSPEKPVFEGARSPGTKKVVATARVQVADPGAGDSVTIEVSQVETITLVAGRRTRVVFHLCPSDRANAIRGVMTQVDAELMTSGLTRAPYVRSACLTFSKGAPGAEKE